MAKFKINFSNIRGTGYVRSSYNTEKPIKKSTGINFDNIRSLNRVKRDLMRAYDSLTAIRPEERKRYGERIDLNSVWRRYLEDIGTPEGVKEIKSRITENVIQEFGNFEKIHATKSKNFCRGAKQVIPLLEYYSKRDGFTPLKFSDLKTSFLTGFEAFLQNEEGNILERLSKDGKTKEKFIKRKYLSGTIKKHFTHLRAICKYAQEEIEVCPAVFNYKVSQEVNRKKEFLSYNDLKKLMEYQPADLTEEVALDIWLFMAFSGLRVSKAQELRAGDIKDGFIFWNNSKSGNTLTLTTIHAYNSGIIKKYKGQSGKLFPYLSQQRINKTIKKICSKSGIDKSISSHGGRHSYNHLLRRLPLDDFDRRQELGHAHGSINDRVYTQDIPEERKRRVVPLFENLDNYLKEVDSKIKVSIYDSL